MRKKCFLLLMTCLCVTGIFNYNHSLNSSNLFFIKQAIPLSFSCFQEELPKASLTAKTYCSFQANYF
jgi:hypothetical protein